MLGLFGSLQNSCNFTGRKMPGSKPSVPPVLKMRNVTTRYCIINFVIRQCYNSGWSGKEEELSSKKMHTFSAAGAYPLCWNNKNSPSTLPRKGMCEKEMKNHKSSCKQKRLSYLFHSCYSMAVLSQLILRSKGEPEFPLIGKQAARSLCWGSP